MFPNSPKPGRAHYPAGDFLNKLPLALGPAILAQHQQQILELQKSASLSRSFLSGNLGSSSPQPWPYGNGSPLPLSPPSSSTFLGRNSHWSPSYNLMWGEPMISARRAMQSKESKRRHSDEQHVPYDTKRQRIESPQQQSNLHRQLVPLREERRYSVPASVTLPLIQTPPRTPDVKGRLPPVQDSQIPHHLETTLPVAKDKLSLQILELFQACQQQASDLKKKDICRAELQREIQQIFPQSRLYLVGSSLNGFGTRDSDADLCLVMQDEPINQSTDARQILSIVLKFFYSRLAYIEKPQLIRAKVPIVKFRDKVSGVEFDLNVNNVVGIRNTFLLRTYAHIENRVRPLVLVVKQWATHLGINDASRGTLSSYTLALMVVHYLQTLPEPILPSLQRKYPECFHPTMQLNLVPQAPCHIPPYFSKNGSTLGDLFTGFLKYFATQFDWNTQMISVREAKVVPRPDRVEWRNKFICVEEPFDGTNTARAVHEKQKFDLIQEAFLKSFQRLQNKKDLNGVMPLRATIIGQKR